MEQKLREMAFRMNENKPKEDNVYSYISSLDCWKDGDDYIVVMQIGKPDPSTYKMRIKRVGGWEYLESDELEDGELQEDRDMFAAVDCSLFGKVLFEGVEYWDNL